MVLAAGARAAAPATIAAALTALAAAYTDEGRGFDLREVAGGWRFYTREECAAGGRAVRQRRPGGPADPGRAGDAGRGRLPAAGQPGPGVGGPRRQLRRRDAHAELRGLVEEAGTDHETGAILYRTTSYFLERLGLASLDDLPELAPFLPDDLDEAEELPVMSPRGRAQGRRPARPPRPGPRARAGARTPATGEEDDSLDDGPRLAHRRARRRPAAEGARRRGRRQPPALRGD